MAACCACSPPGCCATRISTSVGAPNSCSCTSPRPSPPSVARILATSAGPVFDCTSINVPPTKSMPKFSPWKKNSRMATIDSTADVGKLMRRKRMKSNLVSSGTIRSSGREECRRTLGPLGNRELLWARIAHPPGHDESGQGKGREHGGDDADSKRHRKSAHWPGSDEKQDGRRDERGDIGIENGCERAGEARVDRGDRSAAGAHFLADALVDQDIGIHRNADREHDADDARQRERGIEQREDAEDHRDVDADRDAREHAK